MVKRRRPRYLGNITLPADEWDAVKKGGKLHLIRKDSKDETKDEDEEKYEKDKKQDTDKEEKKEPWMF